MRPCDECFVVTLPASSAAPTTPPGSPWIWYRKPIQKKIHVFDSKSARRRENCRSRSSSRERIDAGESFEAIIPQAEAFIANMRTLFVLEDLGNFVKTAG